MTGKVYRSECCNVEVKVEGKPDFFGSKEICTFHFSCLRCGKPCNVAGLKKRRKISAAKKRIQVQDKRFDLRGEMLQKLIELFDGITIHPNKGVILTPKKKLQLAELQKMDQKLSKLKAKKSR